ncbi:cation-translocating P-type ATPase [Wukongibacter baidiensis]
MYIKCKALEKLRIRIGGGDISMLQAFKGFISVDKELLQYKRMRIPVNAIYRNEKMSINLSNYVSSIHGVKHSKANPITGKILVIFDEYIINELIISKHIDKYIAKTARAPNYSLLPICKDKSEEEVATSSEAISPENYTEYTVCKDVEVPYHALSRNEIENILNTDSLRGLSNHSVQSKIKEYGLNVLSEKKKKSFLSSFIENLDDFTVKVLLGAGAVSFFLGLMPEAIALGGVILFQTALGAAEQHKSENSLHSLKDMLVHKATVIRNGHKKEIESKYIVPGDIILLEAGDKIPADARIVESENLMTTEASLTGESSYVMKSPYICEEDTELGNRFNMLFMGTNILSGKAKAIVVATGKDTEIGKIASLLDSIENTCPPLQNKAESFINKLIKIYIGCFAAFGGIALLFGRGLAQVLMMGVTFFLGSIPEGLPLVVTSCMALSVQRMSKKNAIVRNLTSVESLGAADVICCDKTGTLTMNEMTVREVFVDSCHYKASGVGYNPVGDITPIKGYSLENASLEKLVKTGVLCNNSTLTNTGDKWEVQGDPTEGALITMAHKMNLNVDYIKETHSCVKEVPFDSCKRYMTSVVSSEDGSYAYCKGALDTVLDKCTTIYDGGKERLFTSTDRKKLKSVCDKMADKALRILAFAYKKIDNENSEIESNFVFLGLMGMDDPPREGVKESIQKCFKAGIKVVMITGDYMKTAGAVGKQLGLLTNGLILSGSELDSMSDDELDSKINKIQIFARTTPKQKYRIVKALKRCGHVVAMTGDGVNDAPAIKEADIGIAMGKNGSDIARDVACITLVDDNFSTIVAAIEEGRSVTSNVRNTMKYLFSGAIGEMSSIFLSFAFGLPAPLIAIQMIWINLVSETLLGSSLAVEPPSEDVMNYPPSDKDAPFIDKSLKRGIIRRGAGIGISTFGIYAGSMLFGLGVSKARTLAFTNFICSQVANVYNCRSNKKAFANKYMTKMVLSSVALLLGIIYIPFFNSLFGTVPLGLLSWGAVLGSTVLSSI